MTGDELARVKRMADRLRADAPSALPENAAMLRTDAAALDALIREVEAGRWRPITPSEPASWVRVDVWCVYGDEEAAKHGTGYSVGRIFYDKHRAEKYGWMGATPDDIAGMRPVAYRPTAPQCPASIIAQVLGVPEDLPPAPEGES